MSCKISYLCSSASTERPEELATDEPLLVTPHTAQPMQQTTETVGVTAEATVVADATATDATVATDAMPTTDAAATAGVTATTGAATGEATATETMVTEEPVMEEPVVDVPPGVTTKEAAPGGVPQGSPTTERLAEERPTMEAMASAQSTQQGELPDAAARGKTVVPPLVQTTVGRGRPRPR